MLIKNHSIEYSRQSQIRRGKTSVRHEYRALLHWLANLTYSSKIFFPLYSLDQGSYLSRISDYIFSTMSETRENVIMDITMLSRFAAVQRLKDVDKSAFSRSRVDAQIDAFKNLRRPAMSTLSRGFFDSNVDPKTSKGKQRSEQILDAFATIFAGSGGCVAVGAIRDWEKKVVYMIIGGNGTISEGQQQQIRNLYMGLKEIAAVSEPITDRQFLPKDSNELKDSPPTRRYEANSRYSNRFSYSQIPSQICCQILLFLLFTSFQRRS